MPDSQQPAADEWTSLDVEARANLRHGDVAEFFRYRDRLRREGHAWVDDARDILAGFIWDAIEGYDD